MPALYKTGITSNDLSVPLAPARGSDTGRDGEQATTLFKKQEKILIVLFSVNDNAYDVHKSRKDNRSTFCIVASITLCPLIDRGRFAELDWILDNFKGSPLFLISTIIITFLSPSKYFVWTSPFVRRWFAIIPLRPQLHIPIIIFLKLEIYSKQLTTFCCQIESRMFCVLAHNMYAQSVSVYASAVRGRTRSKVSRTLQYIPSSHVSCYYL